jgi:serine/threonine protein kinase
MCGQRPLEGYTIKRAIGRGGFGEVYYALSDGGKEVALKLLRRSSASERRGIVQCLNFKHPHLVHIYDLRETDRGELWIIMEYVHGESLAAWIERYPHGLPPRLIREWFPTLVRAVGYLHSKGVVHRDLKPANIFIEEGTLKVGDYGLVRRYNNDDLERMTGNVGTPQYMAPEIRRNQYGHSVDIYACGVILYEMLIGRPPFDGATAVDILMKHQTDLPDLEPLYPAFRPVLAHALDKDPQRRYQSMTEFAQDVENVFADKDVPLDTPVPPSHRATVTGRSVVATALNVAISAPQSSESPKTAVPPPATPSLAEPRMPPISPGPSRVEWSRSPVVSALVCLVGAVLLLIAQVPINTVAEIFVLATVASWGALLLGLWPPPPATRVWYRRGLQTILGVVLGLFAAWLDGWPILSIFSTRQANTYAPATAPFASELVLTVLVYLLYFGLTMGAIRWWRMTDRQRHRHIRPLLLLEASLWACTLGLLFSRESTHALISAAPLVIAALAVQWAAPRFARSHTSVTTKHSTRIRLPRTIAL